MVCASNLQEIHYLNESQFGWLLPRLLLPAPDHPARLSPWPGQFPLTGPGYGKYSVGKDVRFVNLNKHITLE